ncbi:MAG: serine/threonine-protein kinase [Candidatus Xenobia bacterium]
MSFTPDDATLEQIGPYRVLEILSRHGVALVCRIQYQDREAALKTYRGIALVDAETRERFRREVMAASQVQHPNVCRVLDWGTWENGNPYLILEMLSGAPLFTAVQKGPALALDVATSLILQTTRGLAAIHQAGIMHRNLCPDNLFVSSGPHLSILDFGLSRRFGSEASLTPGGISLGQVPYISPEQMFDARKVDLRTDLFSLGVIAYELLSGKDPFGGRSRGERLSQLSTGSAPPLVEARPDAPPALAEWIHTLLQSDRTRRPQDAGAALDRLSAALAASA